MRNSYGSVMVRCMVAGLMTVAIMAGPTTVSGATNQVEDFESYAVADGAFLDPASVGGSGWIRDGILDPDWEVGCCSGGALGLPDDETFDGSSSALLLRRSNQLPEPSVADENYDFALLPFSNGTVSVEVNPGSPGGVPGAFNMELRDSVMGSTLVRFRHTETHTTPTGNGIGDWIVFSSTGSILADGNDQDDPRPAQIGVPNLFPHAWDRWFRITVTLSGSTFDVLIEDIGPTSDAGTGDGRDDPARGTVLELTGQAIGGVIDQLDQFRLGLDSGNGGSNDNDPTMIDNIEVTLADPPTGTPVEVDIETAVEILYGTQAGNLYQRQYTDDLPSGIWTDIGGLQGGDGSTNSFFDSTIGVTNRNYRVLEF